MVVMDVSKRITVDLLLKINNIFLMIVGNKFHITHHIYVNYLHKGCGCISLKVSNCNYCSILYKVDRY